MKLHTFIISALPFCSFFFAQAQEAGIEQTKATPLLKPELPALYLKAEIGTDIDGPYETPYQKLSSNQFILRSRDIMEYWKAKKDSQSSLKIVPVNTEDISLSYAFYNKKDFLPDIETETINRYIAGLKKEYGTPENSSIEITNEGSDYSAPKQARVFKTKAGAVISKERPWGHFPLNASYKVIEYTVSVTNMVEGQEVTTTTQHMDYVLVEGKHSFLAQFKAPPERFAMLRSTIHRFIISLQYDT